MDWDFLKTIRETIDWLGQRYEILPNSKKRRQLNEISNQISRLAKNNAYFIDSLRNGLETAEEEIDLSLIQKAIHTAKDDTKMLDDLLTKFDLNSEQFTFSFKNGIETLTQQKSIKIKELEKIITRDIITPEDQGRIIAELDSFRKKWIDLGNETDKLFQRHA